MIGVRWSGSQLATRRHGAVEVLIYSSLVQEVQQRLRWRESCIGPGSTVSHQMLSSEFSYHQLSSI